MSDAQQYSLVIIAGDSGDGIQLAGQQLSYAHAQYGHIVQTIADFPAEIRAPAGTIHGVSGFQLCFSSTARGSTGGCCDYLVVFNPAAYQVTQRYVSEDTWIIYDTDKWTEKDLIKAGLAHNPLEGRRTTVGIPLTELALKANPLLPLSAAKRHRNLVALGLILWIHDLPLEPAQKWLQQRFAHKTTDTEAMNRAQQAGYFLGETLEWPGPKVRIPKANQSPGRYIQVTGNQALVLGMAAASDLWQKKAVLCGYPITPASDLLHYTAQWEALANISCLQAEDEIAAAGMALGVSYGGHIGICCTSGPGMDLKAEMIGLGVMAEVPLIIIDVQRAGPSTGMPTKAQQSDLLMALFGRHGSCPVPVLAQCSPEDGVATMLKAVAWSQKASTPVIVLSDALMASATTALKVAALPALSEESSYTSPGPQTARRTLTGLETNIERTEISYEPDNHQKKVGLRRQKIEDLSEKVLHPPEATILLLSYGSTSMALKDYLLANRRWSLAHLELTMLYPLPSNFWDILAAYQTVVAVDLSDEQLGQYLKSYQRRPIISYGQVHGHQFLTEAFDNWLEIQPWCQIITGASSHG